MHNPDRGATAVGDSADRRSRQQVVRLVAVAVMAVAVLVTYASIVWTLRRGFDWTDEAFVYTMIASNRTATGEPWGFQPLLHPFFTLTGDSVLAFRILRLVGYGLLSVALVSGARAVLGRIGITVPRSGWAFIFLLAQAGTFFAWSYPPRYLGYNELASWFTQVGVALIVISLAWGASSPGRMLSPADQSPSWVLWPVWAGLGAMAILLVFAKVTSGVAFGALLAVAIVVPNPGFRLWKRVVGAAAGTTTVLLVLWVCRYPMGLYLRNVSTLLFDQSAQRAIGHPISRLISTYLDSLRLTGRAVLPALLLFTLAMATFRRTAGLGDDSARRKALDRIAWVLGALLLIALVAQPKMIASSALTRLEFLSYLGVLIAFTGLAGVIGLIILGRKAVTSRGRSTGRSLFAVGGTAVVAAPFISAVGTNNPLVEEFVWAATLWAVVLGVALVLLNERATQLRSNARGLPWLVGTLVLLMVALAVRTDIGRPYRSTSLLTQDTSTSVPELRGLLVTRGDAAYIDWISAAGESLGADGVPAIVINSPVVRPPFNSLGALFAFNHSGYANPWLGLRGSAPALESLRTTCSAGSPSDLFVLQPGLSTFRARSTAGVRRSLAECGITFPGDFRVVGRRASRDPGLAMTVWRLK